MSSRVALVVSLAVLVAMSGCVAFVTGGTLSYTASDVRVSQSALDETEYQVTADRATNRTYNVSEFGQNRTLAVVDHVAKYERSLSIPLFDDPVVASFTVRSTPSATVAGREVNPVAEQSTRSIARRSIVGSAKLGQITRISNRTVQILGENRTVEKFRATTTFADEFEVVVHVHVTKFSHEDDFVVAGAAHPRELEGEQDRVDTLLRGIEH